MAKLYIKNTDGTFTPYSTIAVTNLDIVQGKGNSLTSAMSQKAVTDEFGTIQDAIASIVNAGYVFAGVATPSTNPGTPEAKVFYIADGKGTYANFGGLEVTEDEVIVLKYDTAWHKEATGIASNEKLSELESKVAQVTGISDNIELNSIIKEIYIPGFDSSLVRRAQIVEGTNNYQLQLYGEGGILDSYNIRKQEYQLDSFVVLYTASSNSNKCLGYAVISDIKEGVFIGAWNSVDNLNFLPIIASKLVTKTIRTSFLAADNYHSSKRVSISGTLVEAGSSWGVNNPIAIHKGDIVTLYGIIGNSSSAIAFYTNSDCTEFEVISTLVYDGVDNHSYFFISDRDGYISYNTYLVAQNAVIINSATIECLLKNASFGIGHVNVDDSQAGDVGTPSVEVSLTGAENDKTLNFVFKNLKGAAGAKGEKGDQGNSGYTGAVGELEVVNNLTQGGATAALSAEQGVILNRWNNYNTASLVPFANNKASLLKISTASWQATDSYGTVENADKEVYDDVDKSYINARDCISNNTDSSMNGARFVAKLDRAIDMTYNVLRGRVYQDLDFPVADLGNMSISLYSDNSIDNEHRAYIILNYGYTGKDAYIRSGWHHFCVNIPLMGIVGTLFNITNVTHVSFNVNHNVGTLLTCSVGEWDILPNLIRSGIVTIVDNFNPSVPAMADYAASKGVKLNLSIVPNWVGDNSRHGTLQQIYKAADQGHFIFNHTWNHQIYGGQTDLEVFEQIDKANKWMVEHGFIRGAKVLSVPSAAFDNQKYKAFLGSEAAMIYHHWTPLHTIPKTNSDGTKKCILYYPYKGMERLLNISALDSYYTDDFSKIASSAQIGCEAAIAYGGILVFGFHGYGTQYGGYMPDDTAWKAYIDTISSMNIHHYTIDELIEGCFI